MQELSTRAALLFRTSYIYESHHTITSMLKYVHSLAQTCGRVGRRRYYLGCFGGHPPAPPSSYALRRHGSHRLLFTPKLTTTYIAGGARHQPSRMKNCLCLMFRKPLELAGDVHFGQVLILANNDDIAQLTCRHFRLSRRDHKNFQLFAIP